MIAMATRTLAAVILIGALATGVNAEILVVAGGGGGGGYTGGRDGQALAAGSGGFVSVPGGGGGTGGYVFGGDGGFSFLDSSMTELVSIGGENAGNGFVGVTGGGQSLIFYYTGSAQTFDVTTTGVYDITALGAMGGGGFPVNRGGLGARDRRRGHSRGGRHPDHPRWRPRRRVWP